VIKPAAWLFPPKPKPGAYVLRSGDTMTINFTVHVSANDLIDDWDRAIRRAQANAAIEIDSLMSKVEVCL
jgi:hypothetical protein